MDEFIGYMTLFALCVFLMPIVVAGIATVFGIKK